MSIKLCILYKKLFLIYIFLIYLYLKIKIKYRYYLKKKRQNTTMKKKISIWVFPNPYTCLTILFSHPLRTNSLLGFLLSHLILQQHKYIQLEKLVSLSLLLFWFIPMLLFLIIVSPNPYSPLLFFHFFYFSFMFNLWLSSAWNNCGLPRKIAVCVTWYHWVKVYMNMYT